MQYAHANFKFLDCFTSAFIILTHSYSHHLQLAKWNTFIVSVENELLSLVLICHRSTCDIAAGKAWFSYAADVHATWPPVLHGILFRYENRSGRQHYSSKSLPTACLRSWLKFNFAGMPAMHVLIRSRSVPGGTGGYVADTSAAY